MWPVREALLCCISFIYFFFLANSLFNPVLEDCERSDEAAQREGDGGARLLVNACQR